MNSQLRWYTQPQPHARTQVRTASGVLLTLCALSAIAAFRPRNALAQDVNMSFAGLTTTHEEMHGPLVGPQINIRIPVGIKRLVFRVSGASYNDHANGFGVPCTGLINPATCQPESVRDNSNVSEIAGGFGFRLVDQPRGFAMLTVDGLLADVSIETRGIASGRTIGASKTMRGASVGAAASWLAYKKFPLAVEASASFGWLSPTSKDYIVDGWAPFNDNIRATHFTFGFAWRFLPDR